MIGTWGGAGQHGVPGEAKGDVGRSRSTQGDLARGWSTCGVMGRGTWGPVKGLCWSIHGVLGGAGQHRESWGGEPGKEHVNTAVFLERTYLARTTSYETKRFYRFSTFPREAYRLHSS